MPAPSNHLKDHIDIIAKHEEEFLERRKTSERVEDLFGTFVGSLLLMLAEKEVTAVLNLQRKLAAKAGLSEQTSNTEIDELAEATSIDEVARTIRESITTD